MTLSDKINWLGNFIYTQDVKEKIQDCQKELKEEFCMCRHDDLNCRFDRDIDKIFIKHFGEKLI